MVLEILDYLDFDSKSKEFQRILDSQIVEMLEDYYLKGMHIREIISKYSLNMSISEFRKNLPKVRLNTFDCCGYVEYEEVPLKQNYYQFLETVQLDEQRMVKCPNCKHTTNEEKCQCELCLTEVRNKLHDRYFDKKSQSIKDLKIFQRLLLATILQGMQVLEEQDIMSEEEWERTIKLELFFNEISYPQKEIKFLETSGLLTVSPDSSIKAFDSETLDVIDWTKVRYRLVNILDSGEEWYQDLKYLKDIDFGTRNPEVYELKKILVEKELKKLLIGHFKYQGFSFSDHEELRKEQYEIFHEKLNELLSAYTPSQIYAIWWRSIRLAKENDIKYERLEHFKTDDVKFVMSYGIKSFFKRYPRNEIHSYDYPLWGNISLCSKIFFKKFGFEDWFTEGI